MRLATKLRLLVTMCVRVELARFLLQIWADPDRQARSAIFRYVLEHSLMSNFGVLPPDRDLSALEGARASDPISAPRLPETTKHKLKLAKLRRTIVSS